MATITGVGTGDLPLTSAAASGDVVAVSTQRVSQLVAKLAHEGTNEQRVSQLVVKVASLSTSEIRVSQLVVKVARSPKRTTYRIRANFAGTENLLPASGEGTLTIVR